MRALKRGTVTFAGGFAGGLVVKLEPSQAERAIREDGASSFDPSGRGRPMKAWVVLPAWARESWDEYSALAYTAAHQ